MKVRMYPLVLSFCALGLAACASHEQTAAYVEPAAVGGQAQQPDRIEVDSAYISKVERVALRRGIEVHWVNAPNRRVARE